MYICIDTDKTICACVVVVVFISDYLDYNSIETRFCFSEAWCQP